MARRSTAALSSLPAQGFILLILMIALTSSAIGLPAIWLFREQIDRQAQDLVEQGDQMVNVLLEARYNELGKLALLTAQRPTLAQLLESGEPESLAAYLETLQTGAGLDLVMICRTGLGPVAQVGLPIPAQACQAEADERVFIPPGEASAASDPAGWLLASQPLPGRPQDFVVVGQAINSGLSDQLSQRIGLEHLFLFDGELLEGSFPDDESAWEALSEQSAAAPSPDPSTGARIVQINGTSYYTAGSPYGDTGLETVVFLPGTLLSETQQRLTRTIAAGILLVTALGSIVAIILARQVSRPLIRLRDAAVR
ncbi:MAG TPA: hypothetical protein VJ768_05910, partial [Anaerolineales bacterium]|nr:hypothetical protein [Anaerolineales bacterium]